MQTSREFRPDDVRDAEVHKYTTLFQGPDIRCEGVKIEETAALLFEIGARGDERGSALRYAGLLQTRWTLKENGVRSKEVRKRTMITEYLMLSRL